MSANLSLEARVSQLEERVAELESIIEELAAIAAFLEDIHHEAAFEVAAYE